MKLKFIPLIAAAMMLLAVPSSNADNHILIEMNGEESSAVNVAKIKKIKFEASAFNLEFHDADATGVYDYTQVKRITFKDGNVAVDHVGAEQPLVVTPNPVQDYLRMAGGSDLYGADVNIYSVAGMHVMSVADWNGGAINVSHLAPGVYVINIQSTTLKFVKL